MLKSQLRIQRLNKESLRVPKSVQDTIPINTIYKDGIFRIGNRYSKSYRFNDINYEISSIDDKNNILFSYGELINSFDSSVKIKITINNRKIDLEKFKEDILMKEQGNYQDIYRQEYNRLLLRSLNESENIIQEKYITVTVFKNNIQDARAFFKRIENTIYNQFIQLNSYSNELSTHERLKILHDFYRGNNEPFTFDLEDCARKGHSFKEHICPYSPTFKHDHFTLGDKFGRVLYLSSYGSYINEEIISRLTSLNKNLMCSMDIFNIPKDEAINETRNKLTAIETNEYNWGQKQLANNNFVSSPPRENKEQKEACNYILDHLINNDERMHLFNLTFVHLADSLEELNDDSEKIRTAARSCNCDMTCLYFSSKQLDGLVTVLPIGIDRLDYMYRTLLTHSMSTFVPFRAQEIMHPNGIWYGKNKITNNLIIIDKSKLKNANTFILGVPGSGKSFISKTELELLSLNKNDDILLCDPENEYSFIVKEMGGEVINVGASSEHHINAMDMSEGYGDSGNAIGDKSQFIISLFEQLTRGEGITSIERSIIDRCVMLTYRDARRKKYVPTLKTLREMLLKQEEPEAKDLAVKLELFTDGSLNVFAHETNVDVNNRIISFNLLSLGKQLKAVGLLVITDAILNRVNENWKKGKRTHVFIDEVHVIFENEDSATFFASAWRQFRKRNAFPTAITQNVSYLLESSQGKSMLSNSEFVIMLNQSSEDKEILKDTLRLNDQQMNYVTNVQPGCGLIKYESYIVPFINEIPEDYLLYLLNSTKPDDFERQKKFMNNTVSLNKKENYE